MSGCAIPGCADPCRRGHLMCVWHWKKVPLPLRRMVNAAFRVVQAGGRSAEDQLDAILLYRRAVKEAVDEICRQEGINVVAR